MYKTKTVEVDVDIDVDLDDFDTEELIDELKDRVNKFGRKGLNAKEKSALKQCVSELSKILGLSGINGVEIKSLDDQFKVEHLSKVWNYYTSHLIEERLPLC